MDENKYKAWTMYDLELVRTMLGDNQSHREIAEALGRNPHSVSQFVTKNNLSKYDRRDKIEVYLKSHPHVTDFQLMRKFGICRTTCWNYRERLELRAKLRKPPATLELVQDWKRKREHGMTFRELARESGYSFAGIRNAMIRYGVL